MAGLSAAISAAREGASVVLMHERPVLGGNASSEIRMWICGSLTKGDRETGLLEEITLENYYRNPTKSYAVWDTVLYDFAKREENLTLLLNCTCMDAETETGTYADGRTIRIKSVTGYQMTTQRMITVEAKSFCDASGDSILAPLTGAEFRLGREGKDEFGEMTVTEKADEMTMGMSCLIQARETSREIPYTPPKFATKLTKEDFASRNPDLYKDTENFWYLELGGDRDSIGDSEELRDELVALAAGTWDHIKNSGEYRAENWDLEFLGFLPGKRESRRMVGEYIITQRDITDGVVFPDEIAFGGWSLDDHFPGGFYHKGRPNTNIPTAPHYSIPYRALYSKNVENLFFAGRNISMTHTAMSSIRVMATCILLGEAVGRAAALASKHETTPHGVYTSHMEELQSSLLAGDCFLPSLRRKISDACLNATLTGGDALLRNGADRQNAIYGNEEGGAWFEAPLGREIAYRFEKTTVDSVHIVFDSDLERDTIAGNHCERTHTTSALYRLDAPFIHMPKTLCRAFTLYGEREGERKVLLLVEDNRKRSYHLSLGESFDSLILVPEKTWGEGDTVPVISFDFQ